MDTAHTVFEKYRSQARSEDLLREIKYVVEKFQEVWKCSCAAQMLVHDAELVLPSDSNASEMVQS